MMEKNNAKHDGKILSIKNDVIFKAVFGRDDKDCKKALMYLLNIILGRDEDPIVEIEYKNPFDVREYVDDKEVVLDIKVTTQANELIDLEMQFLHLDFIKNRIINYHGSLIHEALKKGKSYGSMKVTISIWIVDDVLFPETESFISRFYFMEEEKHFVLNDITYICCIELPKVNREKRSIEELTPLEICLEFLKYADEKGNEYVDALIRSGGEELNMAYEMLRKATEEEILRERAIAREKFERDIISVYEDSALLTEMAVKKAREETAEEVTKETKEEVARNFKNDGIPIAVIAKNTGLTEEEIEKL